MAGRRPPGRKRRLDAPTEPAGTAQTARIHSGTLATGNTRPPPAAEPSFGPRRMPAGVRGTFRSVARRPSEAPRAGRGAEGGARREGGRSPLPAPDARRPGHARFTRRLANWTHPSRRGIFSRREGPRPKTAPGTEADHMQQPERFSDLPEYAFPRLRALLEPHQPGGEPIAMSLGEPRHPLPPFLAEELARHTHLYGRYPPNEGAPELREAIAAWLRLRYGLPEHRSDPDRHVFPLNGTREGLFAACLALVPERSNGERPA